LQVIPDNHTCGNFRLYILYSQYKPAYSGLAI
jgi:hypothetical protein